MEVPPQHALEIEGLGIVKWPDEVCRAVVRMSEDVADGSDEEERDHHSHAGGQHRRLPARRS